MQKFITQTVANYVAAQPWWVRRKDTIITVLTGLVWVAAFVATYLTDAPEQVAVIVGAVGSIAGALINALTPGAVTPSMGPRLEQQAERAVFQPRHAAPGNWLDDARRRLANRVE